MVRDRRVCTLGEVLTLKRGFGLPAEKRAIGLFPVVGSAKIVGVHSESRAESPGVVIGGSGSIGGAQYIRSPFWPLNTTLWVEDFKGNNPRFCFYLLKSLDFSRFNVGSGVPSLNQNHIHLLPIKIPVDVEEQRQIASILGALDDKIELNRKLSATLEAMARAIFTSWFVDFDPVRAKAEGRDPGLPAEIVALFPDSFGNDGGREIPDGWRMGTVADTATLNAETWTRSTRPEIIEYLDLSTVKWGKIDKPETYAQEDAPNRAQRVLRPGDTIVGTVCPENGSYALVFDEGFTGSTGFAVFRPTKSKSFTYLAVTAKDSIDRLSHLADGAAYPAVRPEVVGASPVVLPPDNVFRAFENVTALLLDRCGQAARESRTLTAIRNALLPKLISGELSVSDAKRILEILA